MIRRWFLLALAAVLAVGVLGGKRLSGVVDAWQLRYALVASVLFVMALPIQASAMWRTIRNPGPPLLAVAVTFGLLPLLAWSVSPLLSDQLAAGLLVAATTPCTLASAAVWTRRAGGNDAVAIMVTVVTNAICFIVTPLWLSLMIGEHVEIDVLSMTKKLGLLVVLPMAAAQLIRVAPPVGKRAVGKWAVGKWATAAKSQLSVLALCGVLCMVFLGAIRTGIRFAEGNAQTQPRAELLLMVALVLAIHLSMFAAGLGLAFLCRFRREDRIAVGFAGSQKTLMVGLQVAMDAQVSILPMVTYHVGQLIVDTLIADRMRRSSSGDAEDAENAWTAKAAE